MKKGLFSSLTGLILIIIITFVLIGLFWVKSFSLDITAKSYDQGKEYASVKQAKDQLLLCHSQTYLESAKLDARSCPTLLPYRINQLAFLDCDEETWTSGVIPNGTLQYVYKMAVSHPNGQRCIADLILYVE